MKQNSEAWFKEPNAKIGMVDISIEKLEIIKTAIQTSSSINDLLNEQHMQLMDIKQMLFDYMAFLNEEVKKIQNETEYKET